VSGASRGNTASATERGADFTPVTGTSDRSTTRASLDADEGLGYKGRTMATDHVSLITKEEAVGVVGTHRMALGAPGGREQG